MLFIPFMMYSKFSKDFNHLLYLDGTFIGLKDNKIYPEFWQSYVSCFDSKLKENTEKRVVVLYGNNRLGFSNRCNMSMALSELLEHN
jgi:hypothetical protein